MIYERLEPLITKTSSLDPKPRIKGVTWVRPEVVCQVKFLEWTKDGSLRAPVFVGLRDDKSPQDVTREEAKKAVEPADPEEMSEPEIEVVEESRPEPSARLDLSGKEVTVEVDGHRLKFSNLEAIFIGALHADHIADYYNYFMLASMENSEGDELPDGPLTVYGPGPAGALPPPAVSPATTIAPANPTPGIKELTHRLTQGYAYSSNIFIREQNTRPITEFTQGVKEIKVPNVGANPLNNRAPNMKPFQIYEDDRVKVPA